ncbi:MAG TPA: response regulator [Pyrinomonadaceae bacterium]|jgi:CheY-like chemotaxis protein|nr:response regulator [Pyrinomonadaceae bacterium]
MTEEKPHILYVEDHEDSRFVTELMLRHAGLSVTSVDNGEDCLKLARDRKFDLILMDQVMPGASGVELCSDIRAFDKETPILFYSARASDDDKEAAIEAGADGYLSKPDHLDYLTPRIWRMVSRRGITGSEDN